MTIFDHIRPLLITRPHVRIHTLRPYTRETLRTRPNLPVVLMYSDVTGDNAFLDRYLERLDETRLEAGVVQFAQINNLLFEQSMDERIHAHLRQTFVNPTHYAGINRVAAGLARDGDPPDTLFVFHRLCALFNIKMLLGRSEETGVPENLDNTLIGDLALLTNDIVKLDEPGGDQLSTIVMFLPEWELDNLPDIGNAVGRFDWMMQKHLNGDDSIVTRLREALPIDPRRIDDVPVMSYVKMVFGIYAVMNSAVEETGSCTFDPTTMSDEPLAIPAADVATFLARRSLTRDAFRQRLAGADGWTHEQLRAMLASYRQSTDITLLRRYPFVTLDERRVLVADLGFVIDLLSSSIYYTHFNAFGQPFADLWGRVFELYAVDLLASFYPAAESTIIRPPTVLHAFKQCDEHGGTGEIDAVLDRGRTMLVCEMKASRLDLNAKLSRDPATVARDIRRKFVENDEGDPKAVRQLARNADAILRGHVPGVEAPDVVYPVLISEERSFESFEMNAYLNDIFATYRNEETNTRIRPLTTMSVDELEQLLPLVCDETLAWEELLEARFDGMRVRTMSVHQALYNLHLSRNLPARPNTLLRDRFAALFPDFQDEDES